jgi:RNA polymerase sigma-70 factor (ECF subfamily)
MTNGDVERLTRMAADQAPALVLYARQWLDAAGADDAVQEALVSLLGQRRPPDNPAAWMYRAVRNAAIDQARAATRRRQREQAVAAERCELFVDRAEALMDAETVAACLNRLSPEHREIVVLRIWCELSYAEIADVVQASVSSVHERYHLALRRMRSAMEKPCPNPMN